MVENIADFFGIIPRSDVFSNVIKFINIDNDKDHLFYKRYYGKELWKKELESENIEIFNSNLDKDIVSIYRYQLLL